MRPQAAACTWHATQNHTNVFVTAAFTSSHVAATARTAMEQQPTGLLQRHYVYDNMP